MNCTHASINFGTMGCRHCGMSLEAIERDRWIPTTERFPRYPRLEDKETFLHVVLGFFDGEMEIGYLTEDHERWSNLYGSQPLCFSDGRCRLTHWRELPDPPRPDPSLPVRGGEE